MSLKLTILGCGSATPSTRQNPTAQLLEIRNHFFLIDCGENTQVNLRKMHLRFSKINHIFISHLHGDHYFGLIGLLSSFHLLDRKKGLTIYGPAMLKDIIEIQLKASRTTLRYPIAFVATQTGNKQILFEDEKVRVSSFPLLHSIPTTGFLFEEKPKLRKIDMQQASRYEIPIWAFNNLKRGEDFQLESGAVIPNEQLTTPPPPVASYAFCSDTAYHQGLVQFIKGVTVLYHETTFLEQDQELARKTRHSTTKDAAVIANEIEATYLITGHYSVRYNDTDVFYSEVIQVFKNAILGVDGGTYELSADFKELKVH